MESWFCSCWISLWMVIVLQRNISADPTPPPHYTIHHIPVAFDKALKDCSPGVLTTLATEQEVADILQLTSKSGPPVNLNELTFWVGLRKMKKECVVPTLPLRGFKWTEDGSEASQVSRWTEEPKHTCTTDRCAALKVELNGSMVTRWGLISLSCKNTHQFICKVRKNVKQGTPEPPKPAAPDRHKPEPRPATQKPESALPDGFPIQGPESESNLRPKNESELQGPDPNSGSEPALTSNSCQHPLITGARSLTLDPDNSSRIQLECWSTVQLELHCSGHPVVWRLLDDSPANFTTICLLCGVGSQKDASGNCVDIDECSDSAPCRHTCLNTEGSYRCVCSDEAGNHQDEDSPLCMDTTRNGDNNLLSGVLISVLVAVATLVVVVLVVVVTVKYYLKRRSKKRAIKKAEKMAMKSKDSFESANEKVTT